MSDLTVLDAGVLISYLDPTDAHHEGSMRVLRSLVRAGDQFATSAVTLSETLVRPAQENSRRLENAFFELTVEADIAVLEVDLEVAIEIARTRAAHPTLKIPDAAVIATARTSRAKRILTTDDRLARFDEAVAVRDFNA